MLEREVVIAGGRCGGGSVLLASFCSLSIVKFFVSVFYKERYPYTRGGLFDEIQEPNFRRHFRQESYLY
jgi:hypothetical protein